MRGPALTPSCLHPFSLTASSPLLIALLLSPVVLSCSLLLLPSRVGMSHRTVESFRGPPDAAGLPNQHQWGAPQRLSLPGRNCGVIELRDNNTFFSLISYQRWIINTIIIVPSHQQRSADASTLPSPELTCSFTRFSPSLSLALSSIASVPLILFPFPLSFTFLSFCAHRHAPFSSVYSYPSIFRSISLHGVPQRYTEITMYEKEWA